MLNLNIYQIIALLFKYFRASLCKVILEFQDFAFCCFFFYIFSALFFSTARQFDVSLLVTLACEPSLFFPFTPFQNCFPRISFWNCRCGRCGDPKIVIVILSPCLSDAPSKKSQLFSFSLPAGQDQYCCLALKCAQCPSDLCVNKALT